MKIGALYSLKINNKYIKCVIREEVEVEVVADDEYKGEREHDRHTETDLLVV